MGKGRIVDAELAGLHQIVHVLAITHHFEIIYHIISHQSYHNCQLFDHN